MTHKDKTAALRGIFSLKVGHGNADIGVVGHEIGLIDKTRGKIELRGHDHRSILDGDGITGNSPTGIKDGKFVFEDHFILPNRR